MSLSDMISADVSAVFLDSNDFAVEVRQYVNGESSSQRRHTAIVTWYPTAEMDDRSHEATRGAALVV